MKVYIVIHEIREDPGTILGVYSSEEKAMTDWGKVYQRYLGDTYETVTIEEFELDQKAQEKI